MGPRPFGRGMRTAVGRRPLRNRRFNGAATFRSRNAKAPGRSALRALRFNGAATFRSRNVRPGAQRPPRGRCFNGAATFRSRNGLLMDGGTGRRPASMGPRPFGRGMRAGIRSAKGRPLLQWGRDLSVAECRFPSRGGRSWGMLQWGRDLSVAECRGPPAITRRPRARFNGAATFRSRNVVPDH